MLRTIRPTRCTSTT